MKALCRRLADLWCGWMHPTPRWPIHGYYQCPVCWRTYRVPWDDQPDAVPEVTEFTGLAR